MIVQTGSGLFVHQALFHRLLAQHLGVHPLTVVFDRQQYVVALLGGGEYYPAAPGLADLLALGRRLDAMIDCIAHQVHQWIGQCIDQVLVEISVFADQLQIDLLVEITRQIPNHTGKATENLLHRLHPGLHHRQLQIGGHHVEIGYRVGQLFIDQVRLQRRQAVTDQHQLADHVHDVVQALGIDSNRGFARVRFRSVLGEGLHGCRGPRRVTG